MNITKALDVINDVVVQLGGIALCMEEEGGEDNGWTGSYVGDAKQVLDEAYLALEALEGADGMTAEDMLKEMGVCKR